MKNSLFILSFLYSLITIAQVGMGTNDPKGALDITTTNNLSLIIPRVTNVESVTDGNANPPLNGSTVYDISRSATCFYQDNQWLCFSDNGDGTVDIIDVTMFPYTYIKKSSNVRSFDLFGSNISLSDDGTTMVVGVPGEDSNATGINGDENNTSAAGSGAVYVFSRIGTGNNWVQEAYIKASNTGTSDRFGASVTLSSDGNSLAVGAPDEDSNATGINGNQANNTASNSGAVYVFDRTGTTWAQQAYIKASNAAPVDQFGNSIAFSGDGNTLIVSAPSEDSNATGINGNQANNTASASGAIYVFDRAGATWSQQAYIKASNTEAGDQFGFKLDISTDGNTLAVSARVEDSNATGINGNQADNSANNAGAVYVFNKVGVIWTQQAYIKASNTEAGDTFGNDISISNDGNTIAVAAFDEDSNATGINGNQANNTAIASGAVYVFGRTGVTWTQQAYIKASNHEAGDKFGNSVAISSDGNTIAVGSPGEDSNATSVNGDQTDNSASFSGAVYVYNRTGVTWAQQAYIKASNTETGDQFGTNLDLSSDGATIMVGAPSENSGATGINGDQTDNSVSAAGAVYVVIGY